MQTWYDPATKRWLTRQADGAVRPATRAEALDAFSRGAQAPAGTPLPDPDPGTPGGKVMPPAPEAPPAPAPLVSYDPPAGGPTYTPGIVFGKGEIPGWTGQRDTYQRQWFDTGPESGPESLNTQFYNDPSNWGFAWDKVVNQFGGMPGSDFGDWLQGFSSKARNDFQNATQYTAGNLNVADFLDAYAPQLKGVYGLMPTSQAHGGGRGFRAGRATY